MEIQYTSTDGKNVLISIKNDLEDGRFAAQLNHAIRRLFAEAKVLNAEIIAVPR